MNDSKPGLFTRLWISIASIFVMGLAVIAIVGLRILKRFQGFHASDPFHNSRRHPLNSPRAPRG